MGSANLDNYRSSLTLEEFQNALAGSSFESMNMDEPLRNVWSAQESQALSAAMRSLESSNGSLSLPRTLSIKAIEEVWKSLQTDQEDNDAMEGRASHQRQIAVGEVTLEDFLVKAGILADKPPNSQTTMPFVVPAEFCGQRSTVAGGDPKEESRNRQIGHAAAPAGFLPKAENGFTSLPLMKGIRYDASQSSQPPMQETNNWMKDRFWKSTSQQEQHSQQFSQQNSAAFGTLSNVNNGHLGKSSIGTVHAADRGPGVLTQGVAFNPGNNVPFNGISFGESSELSPGLDEGSYGTVSAPFSMANQQGIPGQRGRKRCVEAPIEKVIERRQRRMIKNRESAARSRARKQAYTVELEAEVNQLKEENMELLRKQKEEATQRKKQILAVMSSAMGKPGSDGHSLRRTHTGPW